MAAGAVITASRQDEDCACEQAHKARSETVGEEAGGTADVIDFLDAQGFQAGLIAGVIVRAVLLDKVGKRHVLTIHGQYAFEVFTLNALCLPAGGHRLIDHQPAVQVNSRELGGFFFRAGNQQ